MSIAEQASTRDTNLRPVHVPDSVGTEEPVDMTAFFDLGSLADFESLFEDRSTPASPFVIPLFYYSRY